MEMKPKLKKFAKLEISILPKRKLPSINIWEGNQFCTHVEPLAYFQSKAHVKAFVKAMNDRLDISVTENLMK